MVTFTIASYFSNQETDSNLWCQLSRSLLFDETKEMSLFFQDSHLAPSLFQTEKWFRVQMLGDTLPGFKSQLCHLMSLTSGKVT